jgi:hypothetical protein
VIVAVSGHRFYDAETADYLADRVEALLRRWRSDAEVRVVTSLAEGADQLVARVAVELGIPVDVVIPSAGYRGSLEPAFRVAFDELLARAASVVQLDHAEPGAQAYLDAGLVLLDRADTLIAIWDGQQARGTGGTGEVVEEARSRGIDVVIVWPEGYERL